jgi:hypothetical protein
MRRRSACANSPASTSSMAEQHDRLIEVFFRMIGESMAGTT